MRRRLAFFAGVVLLSTACGGRRGLGQPGSDGRVRPSDTDGSSTGDTSPLGGGTAAAGGASTQGEPQSAGGTGGILGTAGDPAATGETLRWCDTVADLPIKVVPVCTYSGSQVYPYGCPKASVTVLNDGTNSYIVSNNDPRIVRCPMAAIDSGLLATDVTDDALARSGRHDVLYYQTMANGLIAFRCSMLDSAGPNYRYRFLCSPTGVQIFESDPKGGSIYVVFPGPDAGYVGVLSPNSCWDAGGSCSIRFYSRTASEIPDLRGSRDLGTHPVSSSADKQTFTFNDLDGLSLAITVLPQSNEVVDVRR
jgi:hypothetical protein